MPLSEQSVRLPRIAIAAPASGHGKTTVATGLMAALRASGMTVSGHKVGPDYIDPSYHALATGRRSRNLDPHLQGEDRVVPLLLHGARSADVAVIEGVMGLFDGALGTDGYASTAHVATLTATPVVLVVDARAVSRSIAALVHGFATFDPHVQLAGVILNQVASDRHETELRSALTRIGVPVFGTLRRSRHLEVPSRHLGLVPVGERAAESRRLLEILRAWIADGVDLDAVVRAARTATPLTATPWDPHAELTVSGLGTASSETTAPQAANARNTDPGTASSGSRPVVAAAAGPAFTFRYTENVELLEAAGVDVVDVDPMADEALPRDCAGLYFGGGFPEVHASELTANEPLRAAVAQMAASQPVVAECAGLTYLCRDLDGSPMTGVLDASARMTERRTLGYRTATAPVDTPLAREGEQVTGHEFHRTLVEPAHGSTPAWRMDGRLEGFADGHVHASYLHVHWAGHPQLAARFAAAVGRQVRPAPPGR